MTGRRGALLAATLLVTAVAASCASATDAASTRALDDLTPVTTAEPSPTTTAPGPSFCDQALYPDFDPRESFAPIGPIPTPREMPEESAMRKIQRKGVLRVGVDENTKYFSYRDARSGRFEGFEPDLARLIAQAIFGDDNPDRVQFVPVVTADKVDAVKNDKVDMTISVVSANCDRWDKTDFTTTYYETTQQILVPSDSPIMGVQDLKDRPVCVTRGSSSQKYLAKNVPEARIVPVDARTDCLVALQDGRADAVLLPHSILVGLQAQDQTTRILNDSLDKQFYGIPIAKGQVEFVQYVNALLERWRADGTLEDLQAEWPEDLKVAAPKPDYREP